jgi:hypothetical protein
VDLIKIPVEILVLYLVQHVKHFFEEMVEMLQ